jgi:cell division protein ZapA (FtsZ GTPase activity inhibitor)
MQDRIPIKIQIGSEKFDLTTERDEEYYLRKAERFIKERLELHKTKKQVFKPERVMAMIAIECMVTFLKSEDKEKALKENIHQKIAKLENLANTVLN